MSKRRDAQMPKDKAASRPTESPADRARRLVAQGAQLLSERRASEAGLVLAEAWELDPTNAAAAINLGGAYILIGKHARAVPVLEAASRLEPLNAMVWVNLAAAYLGKLPLARAEEQDKAIAAFQRALELNPYAPHVNYNLGLIYLERNDPTVAAVHFRQALETDPFDADARHWLRKIESASTNEDITPQG